MIPAEARDGLICYFEGYMVPLKDGTDRVRPYLCPAKVATVGFGSTHYEDGRRVAMSDPPITRARAVQLLDWEIERVCEPAIDRLITVRLHPLMRGALASFTFNLGAGALQASNLRKVINARRWQDVPSEFAKWRVASGKILPGLVRRRAAEAAMFMRGVQALDGQAANDNPAPWAVTIQRAA